MFKLDDTTEALADACASLFGKQSDLTNFRRGKKAKSIEAYGGHYAGYMEEARELRDRLKTRGYVIHRARKDHPHD